MLDVSVNGLPVMSSVCHQPSPVGEVSRHLHHLSDGVRVGASDGADVHAGEALLLHLEEETETSVTDDETAEERISECVCLCEPTNLSDHPLEDVAAADSLENLRCDSLSDAVQTLLDECFTLWSNTHRKASSGGLTESND